MENKSNFLAILLFFSLFTFCKNVNNEKKLGLNKNQLEIDSTFKVLALVNYPVNFEVNDEKIFISDQGSSSVIEVEKSSGIVEYFAKKGRGPKEVNKQLGISLKDHKIYINDQGNLRFQIINTDGEIINSFGYEDMITSFDVFEDQIYCYIQRPGLRVDSKYKDENLIVVYDTDGNVLRSFGMFINIFDHLPKIASKSQVKIYNKRVYVLSLYFPQLKVFDMDGNLINEFDLDSEILEYKKMVSQNYDPISYKNTNGVSTKYLFRAFEINDDGIYVGLYSKDLIIDKFDFEGNHLERLIYEDTEDNFYLFDFKISEFDNGGLEILALVRDNYTQIKKFKIY